MRYFFVFTFLLTTIIGRAQQLIVVNFDTNDELAVIHDGDTLDAEMFNDTSVAILIDPLGASRPFFGIRYRVFCPDREIVLDPPLILKKSGTVNDFRAPYTWPGELSSNRVFNDVFFPGDYYASIVAGRIDTSSLTMVDTLSNIRFFVRHGKSAKTKYVLSDPTMSFDMGELSYDDTLINNRDYLTAMTIRVESPSPNDYFIFGMPGFPAEWEPEDTLNYFRAIPFTMTVDSIWHDFRIWLPGYRAPGTYEIRNTTDFNDHGIRIHVIDPTAPVVDTITFNQIVDSVIYEIRDSTIITQRDSVVYAIRDSTVITYRDSVVITQRDSIIYVITDSTVITYLDSVVITQRDSIVYDTTMITQIVDSTVITYRDSIVYDIRDSTVVVIRDSTVITYTDSIVYDIRDSVVVVFHDSTVYDTTMIVSVEPADLVKLESELAELTRRPQPMNATQVGLVIDQSLSNYHPPNFALEKENLIRAELALMSVEALVLKYDKNRRDGNGLSTLDFARFAGIDFAYSETLIFTVAREFAVQN